MVKRYLQELVNTGMWGKNVTEAAERLISNSLQAMVRTGDLAKLSPSDNSVGS